MNAEERILHSGRYTKDTALMALVECRAKLKAAEATAGRERERAEALEGCLRRLLNYTKSCEGLLNCKPAGQVLEADALLTPAPGAPEKCRNCDGVGRWDEPHMGHSIDVTCPRCGGTGQEPSAPSGEEEKR